jgi:serine protease Do
MIRLLPLLLLLAVTGCRTLAPAPLRTFNDREIRDHLVKEMSALREAGKLASSDMLDEQLARQQVALSLNATPASAVLSPAELYARCEAGVIVVANLYKCGRCDHWHTNAATGFVIHSEGIAVTNYHVIENQRENMLGAMTIDARVVPILEVLAANKKADIAIIRLGGSGYTALPLAEADPVGTPVVVISHPSQRFYTLTSGIISRYFFDGRGPRVAITADFAKGSSGAPVINPNGAVTGVVSSTSSVYYNQKDGIDRNLQMVVKVCIPAQSIRDLLAD